MLASGELCTFYSEGHVEDFNVDNCLTIYIFVCVLIHNMYYAAADPRIDCPDSAPAI